MSRPITICSPLDTWRDRIKIPVPAWLFILTLLSALGMSMQYRLNQLDTWRENPGRYFYNDMPMLTTADGYFWIRMAKTYLDGTLKEQSPDLLRGYPDKNFANYTLTLLPWLIATTSKFTGLNPYLSSLYLIIVLSGLFIIPLSLYAYRVGFPLVGIMGGLLGSVSSEYFIRTSIGRTDTDVLSLFFFLAIAYCIYRTAPSEKWWKTVLYSALAAIFCWLFKFWYEHYFFYGIAFVTLSGYLLIRKTPWKTTLAATILFLAILGPPQTFAGLSRVRTHINDYLFQTKPVASTSLSPLQSSIPIILPDLSSTITEHEQFPFMQSLSLTLTHPYISLTGLIFVVLFYGIIGKSAIPLLPMFGMGCVSLFKQRRFAMFLGPFIGMGLAFAVTLLVALLWHVFLQRYSTKKGGGVGILRSLSLLLAGIIAVYALQPYTFASYIPDPKAFPDMVMHLEKMAAVLPENAKLWNYWNYGYLLQDFTGRGTFNDGGIQSPVKTYFMSRSYSVSTAQEFHRLIAGVVKYGDTGLASMQLEPGNNLQKITEQIINDPAPVTSDPVYVVFTYNMLSQFSTMFMTGTWDFTTGKGDDASYSLLHCQRQLATTLNCMEGPIDLEKGTLGDKAAIGHVLVIKNGKAVRHHKTGHDGFVLELIMADDKNILIPLLLRRPAYYSNFNQMYLMGKYDPAYFELVYDAFPHVRAYRVKPTPEITPTASAPAPVGAP